MKEEAVTLFRNPGVKIGTWLSTGSPVIAELAAECGFDWLLLDMEHGFGSEENLFHQLLAVHGLGAAAIVRVGEPHPDLILRALDRGADGIMIPRVCTERDAEACVQAAHYPPRGRRGYSRSTRSHRYGLRLDAGAPPILLAQMETIEGVANAGAIAAVDGIDVLFVGPADLNFNLRARPDQAETDYEGCLKKVVEAASEHGKQSGILLRSDADEAKLRDMGFTVLAMDSDMGILRTQYQAILKRMD